MSVFDSPAMPEVPDDSPLLLRRIREKPQQKTYPTASHMTVCTTGGFTPEMHDQWEDSTRYDQD